MHTWHNACVSSSAQQKKGPGGGARALERRTYDLMVAAYMERPGQHSAVAKLVGVSPHTTKKAWELGLSYPWGREPIAKQYERQMKSAAALQGIGAWANTNRAEPVWKPAENHLLAEEGLTAEGAKRVVARLAQLRAEELLLLDVARSNAHAGEVAVGKMNEAMVLASETVARAYAALSRGEPVEDGVDPSALMVAIKDWLTMGKVAAERTKKMFDSGRVIRADLDDFITTHKPQDQGAGAGAGGAPGAEDVPDEELLEELRRHADTGPQAVARIEHRMGLRVIEGGAGHPQPAAEQAEPEAPPEAAEEPAGDVALDGSQEDSETGAEPEETP